MSAATLLALAAAALLPIVAYQYLMIEHYMTHVFGMRLAEDSNPSALVEMMAIEGGSQFGIAIILALVYLKADNSAESNARIVEALRLVGVVLLCVGLARIGGVLMHQNSSLLWAARQAVHAAVNGDGAGMARLLPDVVNQGAGVFEAGAGAFFLWVMQLESTKLRGTMKQD